MTSIRAFVKNLIVKKKFITVVSGLPRSGTSMMMSALQSGGMALLTDGIREADANNPKGYYEFEMVKKLSKGEVGWLRSAQGKAVKIITALLQYLPEGYDYRIIMMDRDIDEVLASQHRMLERTGKADLHPITDDVMRQSYRDHLQTVRSRLDKKDWNQSITVNYNDILRSPEASFEKVAKFLDYSVDPKAMALVVDPGLYREQNESL